MLHVRFCAPMLRRRSVRSAHLDRQRQLGVDAVGGLCALLWCHCVGIEMCRWAVVVEVVGGRWLAHSFFQSRGFPAVCDQKFESGVGRSVLRNARSDEAFFRASGSSLLQADPGKAVIARHGRAILLCSNVSVVMTESSHAPTVVNGVVSQRLWLICLAGHTASSVAPSTVGM